MNYIDSKKLDKILSGWKTLLVLLLAAAFFACRQDIVPMEEKPQIEMEGTGENQKIFIVDHTGKRWDITHAVRKYGFDPEGFQFGAGPKTIPPILHPQFFKPFEPGYPSPTEVFQVIGFEWNGDARAYSTDIMRHFEVANDQFGDLHVAIGF